MNDAFPLGEATPPDADLGLGIKPAALHPLTAVVVEAVHGEDFVFGNFLVFQCLDGLFQFVREGFVGIDAEDEVAGGEVVGEVFLVGVAEPVLGEKLGTVAVADGFGRIGGMRVNDDDFVGNVLNGIKALTYLLFLVEGDDNDRKGLHGLFIYLQFYFHTISTQMRYYNPQHLQVEHKLLVRDYVEIVKSLGKINFLWLEECLVNN